VLLDVGAAPATSSSCPAGRSVVTATIDGKRVSRFDLPSGIRLANVPCRDRPAFLVRAEGAYLAAMAASPSRRRAWDRSDPSEFSPAPRAGYRCCDPARTVTFDGGAIFFRPRPNTATLLGSRPPPGEGHPGRRAPNAFLMHGGASA
jgi:hypothetical protein